MDKLGLGRKMERAAMARWVWHGFNCWQPPRAKWSTQDIFDLFDFIAVKPDCPVNFVQVKRHRATELEGARIAISAFAALYPIPASYFLVSWRKAKGNDAGALFEAWELLPNGRWASAGTWFDEVE